MFVERVGKEIESSSVAAEGSSSNNSSWTAKCLPMQLHDEALQFKGPATFAKPLTQLTELRKYVSVSKYTDGPISTQLATAKTGQALSVLEATGTKALVPSAGPLVKETPPQGALHPPSDLLAGVVQSLKTGVAYKRGVDGHLYRLDPKQPESWQRCADGGGGGIGYPMLTAGRDVVVPRGGKLVDADSDADHTPAHGKPELGFDASTEGNVALAGATGFEAHGISLNGSEPVGLRLGDAGVAPAKPASGLTPIALEGGQVWIVGGDGGVYRLRDDEESGARRADKEPTPAAGTVLGFAHVPDNEGGTVLHAFHLDEQRRLKSMYYEPTTDASDPGALGRWVPGAAMDQAHVFAFVRGLPTIDVPPECALSIDAHGSKIGFLPRADDQPALADGQLCVQDSNGRWQAYPLTGITALAADPYGKSLFALQKTEDGDKQMVLSLAREGNAPGTAVADAVSQGMKLAYRKVPTVEPPVAIAGAGFNRLYYATADGRLFDKPLPTNGNGGAPERSLPALPEGLGEVTHLGVDRSNTLHAMAHDVHGKAVLCRLESAKWQVLKVPLEEGQSLVGLDNTRLGDLMVQVQILGNDGVPRTDQYRADRMDDDAVVLRKPRQTIVSASTSWTLMSVLSKAGDAAKAVATAATKSVPEAVLDVAGRFSESRKHKRDGYSTLKPLYDDVKTAFPRFRDLMAQKDAGTWPKALNTAINEAAGSDAQLGVDLRQFQRQLVQDFCGAIQDLAVRTGAARPTDLSLVPVPEGEKPRFEDDVVRDLALAWGELVAEDNIDAGGDERSVDLAHALLDHMQERGVNLPYIKAPEEVKQLRDDQDEHGLVLSNAVQIVNTLHDLHALVTRINADPVEEGPDSTSQAALQAMKKTYDDSALRRYTDQGFRRFTDLERATGARANLAKRLNNPEDVLFQKVGEMIGEATDPRDMASKLGAFYSETQPGELTVLHTDYSGGVEVGWGFDFGNQTLDAKVTTEVTFTLMSKTEADSITFALMRTKKKEATSGAGIGISLLDYMRFGTEGHATYTTEGSGGAALTIPREPERVQEFVDAFVDTENTSMADLFDKGYNLQVAAGERTAYEAMWEGLARVGGTTDVTLSDNADHVALVRGGVTGTAGYQYASSKKTLSSARGELVSEGVHSEKGLGLVFGIPIVAFVTGNDSSAGWFSVGNTDIQAGTRQVLDHSKGLQFESRAPQVPPAVSLDQVQRLTQWMDLRLQEAGDDKALVRVHSGPDPVLAGLQSLRDAAARCPDGAALQHRLDLISLQHQLAQKYTPAASGMTLSIAGNKLLNPAGDGPGAQLARWLASESMTEVAELIRQSEPVFRCEMMPAAHKTYLQHCLDGWTDAAAEQSFRHDLNNYRIVSVSLGETTACTEATKFNPVAMVGAAVGISKQASKGDILFAYEHNDQRQPTDVLVPRHLLREMPATQQVVLAFAEAGMEPALGLPVGPDAVVKLGPGTPPLKPTLLLPPEAGTSKPRRASNAPSQISTLSTTSRRSNPFSSLGVTNPGHSKGSSVAGSVKAASSGRASPTRSTTNGNGDGHATSSITIDGKALASMLKSTPSTSTGKYLSDIASTSKSFAQPLSAPTTWQESADTFVEEFGYLQRYMNEKADIVPRDIAPTSPQVEVVEEFGGVGTGATNQPPPLPPRTPKAPKDTPAAIETETEVPKQKKGWRLLRHKVRTALHLPKPKEFMEKIRRTDKTS